MSSPRVEVVALLREILPPEWKVLDFDRDLGSLRKPTVTVTNTEVGAAVTFRTWQTTVVVDLVAAPIGYEDAEQFLEGALPVFMSALTEHLAASVFAGAERIVREDKHHAWRFTLTLPLQEA